jgi:hypothetical protein
MTISKKTRDAFRTSLRAYAADKSSKLGPGTVGPKTELHCLPVYVIERLASLATPGATGLAEARQSGVQCFATLGKSTVIAYGEPKKMTMETGALVEKFATVYSQLSPPSGGYEIRILKIPGVPLEAIWLNTGMESVDLIAPYFCVGSVIATGVLYSEENFLRAIAKIAASQTGVSRL